MLTICTSDRGRDAATHPWHRIVRQARWAVVLLLALGPHLSAPGAETARRPNVVLILADDMGFSDIGCHGGEIPTPNLDRLAADGLRFTQFYNAGRCCPTRASLLTGLYSHQAGIGHMTADQGVPSYRGHLNDRCVTIAEALREAGYATLLSGKWHVGSQPAHWPLRRGFDRFYGVPQGGGFYFRVKEGRSLVLDDRPTQPGDDFYTTEAFTDYARRFVREAVAQERPFFLYLGYNAPHWPLQARPEDIARHRGRYRDGWDAVRRERYRRLTEQGIVDAATPLSPADPAAPDWKSLSDEQRDAMDLRMAVYAAQVEAMDAGIGRLMRTLDELDVDENTLVLFLSDNGGSAEGGPLGFTRGEPGAETGTADSYDSYGLAWANASNTPFRRYKSWVHEGGIATPLVVRWPARVASRGELRHQVGHVIDLLPTCLEAAGVEFPRRREDRPTLPPEGRSLLPAFRNEPLDREPLYWEHEGNRAVRSGRWKLVAAHGRPWELYDLENDRTERHNLAAEQPERIRTLAADWERWAERVGVQPWPLKPRKKTMR